MWRAHGSVFVHILLVLFHTVWELLSSSSSELHVSNWSSNTAFTCASLRSISFCYNFTGDFLEVKLVGDSKTAHRPLLTKPIGKGVLSLPFFAPTPTSYYKKVHFVAADKFHCGYSVIAAQRKSSCNNFSICRTGNQMFNLHIMLLAIKV